MDQLNMMSALLGVLASAITCAGACTALMHWRKKIRVERFHQSVTPILIELRNGLGNKLDNLQKRFLVKEFVKLASRAAFGTDKPAADPNSVSYANQTHDCSFCGYSMQTDETGACPDCGLGCRHWRAMATPKTMEES